MSVEDIIQNYETFVPAPRRRRRVEMPLAPQSTPAVESAQPEAPAVEQPKPLPRIVVRFPDGRVFERHANVEVKLTRHSENNSVRYFDETGEEVRLAQCDRYALYAWERLVVDEILLVARWVEGKLYLPPVPTPVSEVRHASPRTSPHECPDCSPGYRAPSCTGACDTWHWN